MRILPVCLLIFLTTTVHGLAQDKSAKTKDPSRVLPAGKLPDDDRLGSPRNLKDKYHPWVPPKTKAEWLQERQRIRERILISQGLLPMPPKTPLKAVIHGKVDRGDYTIEKVYFQSHPGHYVTGNLYRPKKSNGKRAGVLCPHGHWENARFYDAGEKAAKKLIAEGGEMYSSAARHHIQARMVGLARLGCVVFHYDMVGYSDSKAIAHRQGFTDTEASLRLQNFMGLQTWNSIRALDFLSALPDVDAERIGVTGASGGGTQTFMLCAIDDRPTVAFPAVMVSTDMQGGCVCENAEYLRIGINNIALAAVFAPKPMALSGAKDWTVNIETKGYPELKQVYSFYGKKENVLAKAYPQFGHNYNKVAREMMYEWFNRHLKLGHKSPIKERDFRPASIQELSVFDKTHPAPKDAKSATELRKYLTQISDKQFTSLVPKTKANVKKYRDVVGTATRMMFGDEPGRSQTTTSPNRFKPTVLDVVLLAKAVISRKGINERVPVMGIIPKVPKKPGKVSAVFWLNHSGKKHLFTEKGKLNAAALNISKKGLAIASADLFGTGEFLSEGKPFKNIMNAGYAGFSTGYNRPLIANRVRDLLTVNSQTAIGTSRYVVVGSGKAGPWTLLAAARMKIKPAKLIVDLNGFSFSQIKKNTHPNFLPGALKYGGIGGLAALVAPTELVLYGTKDVPKEELAPLIQMYKVTGGKLTLHPGKLTDELVVKEVLKK
jgi:dienelactone hydrolase